MRVILAQEAKDANQECCNNKRHRTCTAGGRKREHWNGDNYAEASENIVLVVLVHDIYIQGQVIICTLEVAIPIAVIHISKASNNRMLAGIIGTIITTVVLDDIVVVEVVVHEIY